MGNVPARHRAQSLLIAWTCSWTLTGWLESSSKFCAYPPGLFVFLTWTLTPKLSTWQPSTSSLPWRENQDSQKGENSVSSSLTACQTNASACGSEEVKDITIDHTVHRNQREPSMIRCVHFTTFTVCFFNNFATDCIFQLNFYFLQADFAPYFTTFYSLLILFDNILFRHIGCAFSGRVWRLSVSKKRHSSWGICEKCTGFLQMVASAVWWIL